MNKAARNEQLKITATWLNGTAVAALAVGGFAPVVTSYTTTTPVAPILLASAFAGWLCLSLLLHLAARKVLGRIEE